MSERAHAASCTGPWYLYVVRTANGSLYTGVCTDLARRLREHASGARGAKALRGRGPLTVVYQARLGTQSRALRAERRLKSLTPNHKRALVAASPPAAELLRLLRL